MTIFAGVVARSGSGAVPRSVATALRQHVSRFPGEVIQDFVDGRSHLLKVDLGHYSSAGAFMDSNGSVSMLAGEPLLMSADGNCALTREQDLRVLHDAWNKSDWQPLSRCVGTYCAVHYDAVKCEISLIADKMGVRPIYYWVGTGYTVFATALRILEGVAEVVGEMDLRGVAEVASFGYPLGDRTPFANVKTIRESEVVHVRASEILKHRYWRVDRLPAADCSISEAAGIAYEKFVNAVRRRVKSDRTAASFLSGGLDSRVIAATLRALNVGVHTVNFSKPGTQDYVFGASIAKAIGSMHQQIAQQSDRTGDPYRKGGVARWLNSESVAACPPERRGVVWSGDGGSVGVGHVYLKRSIVDFMRTGALDLAMREYYVHNGIGINSKLFRARMTAAIVGLPKESVKAELSRIDCDDAARSFHLFLMFNDQRRHLTEHFENIDLDRIELQLPFFDSDFIDSILTLPIDPCVGHGFYMEWLKKFAPAVTAVPWQAYPGHAPCPIPLSSDLGYQWDSDRDKSEVRRQLRAAAIRYGRQICGARRHSFAHFNLAYLGAAGLITYAGLQDYTYVLRVASVFSRYWQSCEGRYTTSQLDIAGGTQASSAAR